jgi:hypothetical protein
LLAIRKSFPLLSAQTNLLFTHAFNVIWLFPTEFKINDYQTYALSLLAIKGKAPALSAQTHLLFTKAFKATMFFDASRK